MHPKITQKHCKRCVCLFPGNIRKTPFFTLIAAQRALHLSKKRQRKNLAQAIYYLNTPKGTLQHLSSEYAGWTRMQHLTWYFKSCRY